MTMQILLSPGEPISQIVLPTPFPVGDVACYLIRDEKNVLVDCGPATPEAWIRLRQGLDQHGLAVRDIDELWITHAHADHFGLAARIAEQSGAPVLGHPSDLGLFRYGSEYDLFDTFFAEMGLSGTYRSRFLQQFRYFEQFITPLTPDRYLGEDTKLRAGRLSFQVWHLPGHAPGHVGYYNPDHDVLLGGDVLLSHITSNALIAFDTDTGTRRDSLAELRTSIARAGKAGTVLPGHGPVISRPGSVADRHLQSQELRLRHVIQQLRKPRSALDLTFAMFPRYTTPERAYLPFSEVLGYLDWGLHQHLIIRDDENGVPVFRAASPQVRLAGEAQK